MAGWFDARFLLLARRVLGRVALFTLAFGVLYVLRGLLMPLVLAFLASLALRPLVSLLCSVGVARWLAALMATLLFLAVVIGLTVYLSSLLLSQGSRLLQLLSQWQVGGGMERLVPSWLDVDLSTLWRWCLTAAQSGLGVALSLLSKLPEGLSMVMVVLLGVYYFCHQKETADKLPFVVFSEPVARRYSAALQRFGVVVGRSLRVWMLLVLMTFAQTWLLLTVVGVPYAALLSVLAAVADVLPVIGQGIVLLPVAAVEILNGRLLPGIVLLLGWVLASALRQMCEAKWLAKSLSLHPLWMVLSMYAGLHVGSLWLSLYLLGVGIVATSGRSLT